MEKPMAIFRRRPHNLGKNCDFQSIPDFGIDYLSSPAINKRHCTMLQWILFLTESRNVMRKTTEFTCTHW